MTLTLLEHARAWVDMAPHVSTLTRLASGARTVAEFGTRTGVSTWALLDGLPDDGVMVSVDVAEVDVPARVHGDPRWTFVQGDSLDSAGLLPAPLDLAFVDTTHEYGQTLGELELLRSLGCGTILLHDWNLPGVGDAVRGFCDRSPYRLWLLEPSEWGLAGLRA